MASDQDPGIMLVACCSGHGSSILRLLFIQLAYALSWLCLALLKVPLVVPLAELLKILCKAIQQSFPVRKDKPFRKQRILNNPNTFFFFTFSTIYSYRGILSKLDFFFCQSINYEVSV